MEHIEFKVCAGQRGQLSDIQCSVVSSHLSWDNQVRSGCSSAIPSELSACNPNLKAALKKPDSTDKAKNIITFLGYD